MLGKVKTTVQGFDDRAFALLIQPDQKIIVVGLSSNGTDNYFVVLRYTAEGALDSAFGTGGRVIINETAKGQPLAALLQPDGKIVAGGYLSNGSDQDFAIVRLNSDGGLDTSFGSNGLTTLDFGGGSNDSIIGLALQMDGKILAAGHSAHPKLDCALARFESNGSLDTSFGTNGRVITAVDAGVNQFYSVLALPGGQIVAAGRCQPGDASRLITISSWPDMMLPALLTRLLAARVRVSPAPIFSVKMISDLVFSGRMMESLFSAGEPIL